jgi:hypothetical protein
MPRCEPLEDRAVPVTFAVTTTLDVVDPADGKQSLREAIFQANGTAGADTILLPAGVFRFARLGEGENGNGIGDYDLTDSVTIRGAGAGLTIINGRQQDRLFDLLGSIDVRFAGLTLRNGGTSGGVNGGAIQAIDANIVVVGCVLRDNRALVGGAINDETGAVRLTDSQVIGNVAQGDGGGLRALDGELTVESSLIRRNLAGVNGGGFKSSTAIVTGSTISANFAGSVGGGANVTSSTIVSNSVIQGNSAGGEGGGVASVTLELRRSEVKGNFCSGSGGGLKSDTLTLTASTVGGNYADGDGGGIAAATATLTRCTLFGNSTGGSGGGGKFGTANWTNCTISGNSAVVNGGGINASSGSVLNCTVVENSAGIDGGGLFAGTQLTLRNSIIAINLARSTGPDGAGGGPAALISQGHNLIGDFTDFIVVAGDITGTSTNPLDPKLGPLANNGGPTRTMVLLAGSKAIDAGDNPSLPATDQRGSPRKKDGNGDGIAVVDIGAFER